MKWSRIEALRRIIQILDIAAAMSYQGATVREIYNYRTGFSGLGIWNQKISKALPSMQW